MALCEMCFCQEEVQELSRRLTAIDCQLRKSEVNRKHLEMSNKRLLGFAQVQHSCGAKSCVTIMKGTMDWAEHWPVHKYDVNTIGHPLNNCTDLNFIG